MTAALALGVLGCACASIAAPPRYIVQHRRVQTVQFVFREYYDPRKTFKTTFSLESDIQQYEKLKIADAVDFDDALENVEVLYKKGLAIAKSTPSQNFRANAIVVGLRSAK